MQVGKGTQHEQKKPMIAHRLFQFVCVTNGNTHNTQGFPPAIHCTVYRRYFLTPTMLTSPFLKRLTKLITEETTTAHAPRKIATSPASISIEGSNNFTITTIAPAIEAKFVACVVEKFDDILFWFISSFISICFTVTIFTKGSTIIDCEA